MSGANGLIAAFNAHTGRTNPAIIHDGAAIGYPQLAKRVNALAEALGPAPGTVAVFATHTPDTVIALLGVLAAGGAYCPIDPGFPAARQSAMLAAAGCRTILLTADGQQPPPGLRALTVSEIECPATEVKAFTTSDSAAYVLFTSGSTGAPKPVETPLGAIHTSVAALRELFGVTGDDRVLQFASLNWDTSLEEILPTLTAGATLVIDSQAHTGSFPRFLRMIAERGVTVADLPTAFWHELVHHLSEEGRGLPECLRLLVIGGEAAQPARLAEWHRLDTGVRLLNTYGCTETTLITHAAELKSTVDGAVPIGHRLPHVVEHITADGELLIGGPALARGYPGSPGATAERFVTIGGTRYFRTRDRVGRNPDGGLRHLGRIDAEIKIRGVRVDPTEVETLISAHPGVAAVSAVGATVAGRTQLAAYLVAAPHTDPAGLHREVLADLRSRVPAHLVPGRITVVDSLVHTATGKVDRAATHRRYTPVRAGRRST